MPNLVPVTLVTSDSQYDFEPVALKDGLGTLVCQGPNTALSPTVTVSSTRPTKTSRLRKSRLRIVLPMPKIVGGVATDIKGREATIDLQITIDESAPYTDAGTVKALLLSALSKDMVNDVMVGGKSLY